MLIFYLDKVSSYLMSMCTPLRLAKIQAVSSARHVLWKLGVLTYVSPVLEPSERTTYSGKIIKVRYLLRPANPLPT